MRAISKRINRSHSSISREFSRNDGVKNYLPSQAENHYLVERKHSKMCKLSKFPAIYQHVMSKLKTGRLKREQSAEYVSHESIYSYIYAQDQQMRWRNKLMRRH